MAARIPRNIAIQMLAYCDQFDAEVERGNAEPVVEALRLKFCGFMDDFDKLDAIVAMSAARALAIQSLNEETDGEDSD